MALILADKGDLEASKMGCGNRHLIDGLLCLFRNEQAPLFICMHCGRLVALLLLRTGRHSQASQIYCTLMILYPQLFHGPINVSEFLLIQEAFTGLAKNMASAVLLEYGDPVKALIVLEICRVMLNQILFAAATAGSSQFHQVDWPGQLLTNMEQMSSIALRCKQALREDEALVSLLITEFKSQAVIIGYDDVKSIKLANFPHERLKDSLKLIQGSERCTEGSSDTKFERSRTLRQMIQQLWQHVVKPSLDALGYFGRASRTTRLPRIWWVSSGAAGLLPLHAARDWKRNSTQGTLEYVVSSYTPTLGYWLNRRNKMGGLKLFGKQAAVIAMKDTPGRKSLDIEGEISAVKESCSEAKLYENFMAEQAKQVISDCGIVHCACYSQLNHHDPGENGLILRNGPLTVQELLNIGHKDTMLAYLSACSTAETPSEELVDLAIHIANVFLSIGYRRVIGPYGRSMIVLHQV